MDTFIEQWTHVREQFPVLISLAGNIVAAILIFIIGMTVGGWVRSRVRNSRLGGKHLDATLKPVLASVVFYIIAAMTLYAVLIKVGVPPSSLIAIFGAAGLAIGLALKDTLSNIASGMMLLFLRPIAVGEFADLGSTSGTVTEVGLFATTLKTSEGIFQYVPNSQVWNQRIQNFGRHEMRQLRFDIGVSYDSDLRHVKAVLIESLSTAEDRIINDEVSEPEAFVMLFADSSVNFNCRVWIPSDNWLHRTSEIRIQAFEALGKANIEIPFPQHVVTMKS